MIPEEYDSNFSLIYLQERLDALDILYESFASWKSVPTTVFYSKQNTLA